MSSSRIGRGSARAASLLPGIGSTSIAPQNISSRAMLPATAGSERSASMALARIDSGFKSLPADAWQRLSHSGVSPPWLGGRHIGSAPRAKWYSVPKPIRRGGLLANEAQAFSVPPYLVGALRDHASHSANTAPPDAA